MTSRQRLAEGRTAALAAPAHRPRAGPVAGSHLPAADRARDRVVRGQALPYADRSARSSVSLLCEDAIVARRRGRAARGRRRARRRGSTGARSRGRVRGRSHQVTLRNTPTTRPRMRTSLERIGSMAAFSGCRRTWSDSRKKRLTVASSPTSATTISPSLRGVLRAHDDEVALEDAGVLHRLAADAQDVLAVLAAGDRGHLDVVLDVLLGQDRLSRPRPGRRAAGPVAARRARSPPRCRPRCRRPADAVEQLDRARLGRVAAQQAELLEVGQVRVHGRRRGEADGLADVAHRRRIAVLRRVRLMKSKISCWRLVRSTI